MWIQLRTVYYVEKAGKQERRFPGDWINIGKQEAFKLISNNQAWIPETSNFIKQFIDNTSGVVFLSEPSREILDYLNSQKIKYIVSPDLSTLYSESLIWNPSYALRLELIPVGFRLLEKWQLCIPLLNYKTLAAHVGKDKEREETKAIIRDLRVPIKNPDMFFIRLCKETRQLLELYYEDIQEGKNKYLSFLRAFYQVKALCCDLPPNWSIKAA